MSLAENIYALALKEAEKANCNKLVRVRVKYGPLTGLMPDALAFCFETLIKGSPHEGAKLEIIALPLLLKCPLCGAEFGSEDKNAIWLPCPECGEVFGHTVLKGRELLLSQIEAIQISD